MSEKLVVFVYGSLMKNFSNEMFLEGMVDTREHAVTELPMALFSLGAFPALVQDCRHGTPRRIHGELLVIRPEVSAECLRRLDHLEGYCPDRPERSLYLRKPVSVVTDDGKVRAAIVYAMDISRVKELRGTPTDLDDWHRYFRHSAR